MKEIAELHKTVDAIDKRLAEESAKLGKPITCQGKGCCACCYEPVYCSSAEAKHLVEALTTEQRAAVTERLKLALAKVQSEGLLWKKEMPTVMKWLAMKSPCPLLENGMCLAYENRPISCRSHMAVGPAEWCATNRLEQKYPMAEESSLAVGQAVVKAHLKLGNTIIYDNLLALLEQELLGEYHPTGSAQQIVFEEESNIDKEVNKK